MAGRIVVYGATGYTGGLVADELAGGDVPLVVAGRSADRLTALADRLGAETIVADASRPDGTMTAALDPGDVLVSTVGPFVRVGAPAVEAAVRAGVHYVDSTGEGAFIRRVFEHWGPRAEGRSLLLPAFGYDFVPGNLAGALALRDAGDGATAVAVGYFFTGQNDPGDALSSGTAATIASMAGQRRHAFRDGRLVDAGGVPDRRSFDVDGRTWQALAIPASEQFDLPAAFPQVRDVETYIGWFGPATPAAQVAFAAGDLSSRLPGLGAVLEAVGERLARRTGIGPDEEARARSGSLIVAEARASDGTVLATTRLEGPNGYTLTGRLMAWAARRLATDPPAATGAHGPVTAFGLDDLEHVCAELGLARR